MTQQPDWAAALAAPTPPEAIHSKPGRGASGRLSYVTARFVMDRLDAAVGPAMWQDRYEDRPDGSVRCGIGIHVDGEWVWKWDVGTESDIESEKGVHSDAFKRAGVKWGIARDLYDGATTHGAAAAPPPSAPQAGRGSTPPRPAASTVPPEPEWIGDAPSAVEAARTARGAAQGVGGDYFTEYGTCPDHGATWRHVPAGVSTKTGKPYGEFWACPERGCREKPTQDWVNIAKERAA